jgi:N-acyl-D-amino-acid deacylase
VVFDEEAIDATPPTVCFDLPGGGLRMVTDAVGISLTMIAGVSVFEGGSATRSRPGRLLRSGASAG